ncbi:unnamed protein product [Caenorhabditis auriculariae]|uniref:DUF4440 domain-containing protein n=1 Tax=Caenorhabditis auriculariae TaxID=2777116 RepID=A0A8S1HMS9_9PELO|nr:unnamed protein product [Caenorhabditis auriculariae]
MKSSVLLNRGPKHQTRKSILKLQLIRMSLTNQEAQQKLEPFVNDYVEKLNSGDINYMNNFYHKESVMVEQGKSCLYGKEAIVESLRQMMTECGKTTMQISNSQYQGVGDFIHIETDFVFQTEKSGDLKGHYLQIWRKDGDGYTIYHDEYQMI